METEPVAEEGAPATDEGVTATDESLDCNPMDVYSQSVVLELTPLDGESRTIALDSLLGGGLGSGQNCHAFGASVLLTDPTGGWELNLTVDAGTVGQFQVEGEGFVAVVPLDEPTCISPVRLELDFTKSPQDWRYVSWRSSWDSFVGDVTVEELEADSLKILAHSDLELTSATYGSLRVKSTVDVYDRCGGLRDHAWPSHREGIAREDCQRDLVRSAATYG